jgi:hypothetical protein
MESYSQGRPSNLKGQVYEPGRILSASKEPRLEKDLNKKGGGGVDFRCKIVLSVQIYNTKAVQGSLPINASPCELFQSTAKDKKG